MDIYEFPDVRHDKRDNDSKFNGLITRNNPKSAGLQKIQSRLFGFFFFTIGVCKFGQRKPAAMCQFLDRF